MDYVDNITGVIGAIVGIALGFYIIYKALFKKSLDYLFALGLLLAIGSLPVGALMILGSDWGDPQSLSRNFGPLVMGIMIIGGFGLAIYAGIRILYPKH